MQTAMFNVFGKKSFLNGFFVDFSRKWAKFPPSKQEHSKGQVKES